MAHEVVISEPKEYKYAIIIDGLAYVLTEEPEVREITNGSGRLMVTCGEEFAAYISQSSTYVLLPYEDWLSAGGPSLWTRRRADADLEQRVEKIEAYRKRYEDSKR